MDSCSFLLENNVLKCYLSGKVDTDNSIEIENLILKEIAAYGPDAILIDAENLVYISSFGLRMILKLAKIFNPNISIINVSQAVYDIFEMTGFTQIIRIEKQIRHVSIENCEHIGAGATCDVYRLDKETIVKVYKPSFGFEHIKNELSYAKKAFIAGVPTAISFDIVKCGDSYGVVFELLGSDTLSNAIKKHPERFEEYMDKYVNLLRQIHSIHVNKDDFEQIKNVLKQRLNAVEKLITPEEKSLCLELIDLMQDRDTLIHGDFHPGNIMIQNDELMLIDMVDLTAGPSLYDEICIYRDLFNGPILAPEMIQRSVGLDLETIKKVYDAFLKRWLKTDDPSEIEAYLKKMELLTAFNTLLILQLGGEELINKIGQYTVETLFRGTVMNNLEQIKALLKN